MDYTPTTLSIFMDSSTCIYYKVPHICRLGPEDGAERDRRLAVLPRHDGEDQHGGEQARPREADHGGGAVSVRNHSMDGLV